MTTSRIVTVAAAAVLAGALAAQAQQVSEKSNRDRKVITTEEIEAAQVSTAYQVVERVRPEFLRRMSRPQAPGGLVVARGGASARGGSPTAAGGGGLGGGARGASGQSQDDATEQLLETPQQRTAAVFVDGTEMGGVEELQRIQSNLVEEIRYLNGPDAGAKYGPRFSAGVIEVKLRNH